MSKICQVTTFTILFLSTISLDYFTWSYSLNDCAVKPCINTYELYDFNYTSKLSNNIFPVIVTGNISLIGIQIQTCESTTCLNHWLNFNNTKQYVGYIFTDPIRFSSQLRDFVWIFILIIDILLKLSIIVGGLIAIKYSSNENIQIQRQYPLFE
jgi:hypothetical protein